LLRIVLFKMSEEFSVREVLKARSVVGHHVSFAWEEEADMAVTVLALVIASIATQAGRGPVTGHGAFGQARQSGGVVRTGGNGQVLHRLGGGNHRGLSQLGGLLQVAVGDVARRVGHRHQAVLDGLLKGFAPQVALSVVVEEDAAHAWLGCIGGPMVVGGLRHDLCQVGRTSAQVSS
jgi:hypothetical protein